MKHNPALEALHKAVNRAIEQGSPVFVNQPASTITKRLSWRTRKDQFFQSFGCGQTHVIRYMGTCESCGRSVYSHGCTGERPCGDLIEDSPDPRGIIPAQHCMNLYHASESGLTGRDLIACYDCAQEGNKYRALMAKTKATGTWKAAAK